MSAPAATIRTVPGDLERLPVRGFPAQAVLKDAPTSGSARYRTTRHQAVVPSGPRRIHLTRVGGDLPGGGQVSPQ